MALTRFQDSEAIQKDIKELHNRLETLKKEYEQYFLGLIREEPEKLRNEVKGLINKNFGVPIQNATLKFQLNQLVSRYNTYTTYWDRILREMEEGKYQRHLFKTKLHEQERKDKTDPIKTVVASTKKIDIYQNMFDQYKNLKKNLQQDISKLTYEKFKNQLKTKVGELEKKGENFTFRIYQDKNEIKIKLQKKKKDSED